MSKYIIVAPDQHSVTVSLPYGISTLMHGTFTNNDFLAKTYPEFLKPVPDDFTVAKKEEQKTETPKVEMSKKEKKTPKTPKKPDQKKKTKKNMFSRG
jgi:hypothetical protein